MRGTSNWWDDMEAVERLLPAGTHRRQELVPGKVLRREKTCNLESNGSVDPSKYHSKGQCLSAQGVLA